MKTIGLFDQAAELCPAESVAETYASYATAERRDDAHWCEHPRWKRDAENKPIPNYYTRFTYFSTTRGRELAMTACAECGMLNAVDAPEDLKTLDAQRQKQLDNYKAKNKIS